MQKYTTIPQIQAKEKVRGALDAIFRDGAQKMLQMALEEEVSEFIEKMQERRDERGLQQVTRNGYMPERPLLTGIGPLKIRQPRIDDRELRKAGEPGFVSDILPKYLRRTASLDNVLPVLYLKGISLGAFQGALEPLLGEGVKNLSSQVILRLKARWEQDYLDWNRRDLTGMEFIYIWADGIHFETRMEDSDQCVLVIIGADTFGKKHLLALEDGFSENSGNWERILLDLVRRGLTIPPKLAIADGALGFWKAASKIIPTTVHQRCWVHKMKNVLLRLPESLHPRAKSMMHEMFLSPTREEALEAFGRFVREFEAKYPKATECLVKDQAALFAFYDFPAEHWAHIRTSNPIESTFSTVRLRTNKTRGCLNRKTTLAMAFKLSMECQKTWRRLRGFKLLTLLKAGHRFIDGKLDKAA